MNLSTNHSTCPCDYSVTLCYIYSTGLKIVKLQKKKNPLLIICAYEKKNPTKTISLTDWDREGGVAVRSGMNQDTSALDLHLYTRVVFFGWIRQGIWNSPTFFPPLLDVKV